MTELLSGIADSGEGLSSYRRLRLLLDAALAETGVDIIGCFLHADFVPFASALTEAARDAGRVGPAPFWPFCFPGTCDPVPLFAMLGSDVARRIAENPDADYVPPAWYPSDDAFRFGFSYRENVARFRKRTVRDGERRLAILFFSQRLPGAQNDRVAEARRRTFRTDELGAFPCSEAQADGFAGLVRQVLVGTEVLEAERNYYSRLTDDVLGRAKSLAQIDGPTPVKLEGLRRFFQWLLDAAVIIVDEPTLVASAFCVALPNKTGRTCQIGWRSLIPATAQSPRDLCLVPIADSGLSEPLSRRVVSRPFWYRDMLRALARADRMLARQDIGRSRPFWSLTPFKNLSPATKQCGLITVATHMGAPLYLADVQRRFCVAAPLYGFAYAEPHSSCRTAFCIPLLKQFRSHERDDGPAPSCALGAISLETSRHLAIRPRDASYLACLFHEATQYLPEALFDWTLEAPLGLGAWGQR